MNKLERRTQSRYLCADIVHVTSTAGTMEAVLEDISALGGCVQVEEQIPVHAAITLEIGDAHFRGRVCYCVYRDYGYFVGIRFDADEEWSVETVTPRHLTSLRDLDLRTRLNSADLHG